MLESLNRSKALRITALGLLLQFSAFHNIFPFEAAQTGTGAFQPARSVSENSRSPAQVSVQTQTSDSPLSPATTAEDLVEEARSLALSEAEANLNPETEPLSSLETFVQSLTQREIRLEEILTELPSLLPDSQRTDTETFNTFPSDWTNKKPTHVTIQNGGTLRLRGTGINYQAQAFENVFLERQTLPTYQFDFRSDRSSNFLLGLEGNDSAGGLHRLGLLVNANGRTRIQILNPTASRLELPEVYLPFLIDPTRTYTLEIQVGEEGIALRVWNKTTPRPQEALFSVEDPSWQSFRAYARIRNYTADLYEVRKSWSEFDPRLVEVESIEETLQAKLTTTEPVFLERKAQTLTLTPEEKTSPFPREEGALESLIQDLNQRETELTQILQELTPLLPTPEERDTESFNSFPPDWVNKKPTHVTIQNGGTLRLRGTGINYQAQAFENVFLERQTLPTYTFDFRADRSSNFLLGLEGRDAQGRLHRLGLGVNSNGRTRIQILDPSTPSLEIPQVFLPFLIDPTRTYTLEIQAGEEEIALRIWNPLSARPPEALFTLEDASWLSFRAYARIRSYTADLYEVRKTWLQGTPQAIAALQSELSSLHNHLTLAQAHLDLLNALDNIPRLTNQTTVTIAYTWLGQEKSQTVSLDQEGANSFTLTELDSLGRTVTAQLTITRDTVPPEILSTSVLFTNQTSYTLTYTVDGVSQSQDFALVEGDNLLSVSATDLAGNTAAETFTVTYDPTWVREERSWLLGDKNLTLILNPFPGEATYQSDLAQWTPDEVTELLPILGEIIPAINLVYGNPFMSAAYSIAPLRNRTGGWFDGTSVALGVGVSLTAATGVLVHELAHAFDERGRPSTLNFNLFEEGMAEAVRSLAFRYTSLTEPNSPFHNLLDQIHYEGAIRENHLAGYGIGNPLAGVGISSSLYDLGSYFWSKLYFEDNTILRRFNEEVYERMRQSSIPPFPYRADPDLLDILRTLKPTVEGLPFDDWVANQHLLIPPREVFEQYRTGGLYMADSDGGVPTIYAYEISDTRQDNGSIRLSLSGEVLWRNRLLNRDIEFLVYDASDTIIAQSTVNTGTRGIADPSFRAPQGYTGRLKLVARMQRTDGQGYVEEIAYQTIVNGNPADAHNVFVLNPPRESAVFGVLTTLNTGEVTLRRVGEETTYTVQVVNGAFNFPDAPPVEGTFEITYRNPETGQTLTRYFTKDRSRYYVQFDTSTLTT